MTTKIDTSNRDEIVAKLFQLFRCGGYEGVSIGDISKATGLGKSSLYHHFPGGKSDMAAAVVTFARDWMKGNLLDPLAGPAPLPARIDGMIAKARDLYGGGTAPCLVASMLVTNDGKPAETNVGSLLSDWIAALSDALQGDGAPKTSADMKATNAIVRIEGALLVARATGQLDVFERALAETRDDLLTA